MSILNNKVPEVKTTNVFILPFFPFEYWDRFIEPKNYKGVYGNRTFFKKFKKFWSKVEKKIAQLYKNKQIVYINHSKDLALDRDKEATKDLLTRAGVSVPHTYKTKKYDDIIRLLDKNHKLFIKVRFGAMGKGITYLKKGKWMTNFRFRKGKILSRKSDYGWTFIGITGNQAFLKELLKKDIVIEEAIPPFLIDSRKFDLRMYVSFGKVVYIYARSTESEAITTNISQGARGEMHSFLKKIPKSMLIRAKKTAIRATKAMKVTFAGVDVMFDGKTLKPVVIEANVFSGFPKSKRFNLAKLVLSDVIKHRLR